MAQQAGLRHGKDFECRRYVDDYIIFSNSTQIVSTIKTYISDCLEHYKLNLNANKEESLGRPFQTRKSQIILSVQHLLSDFRTQLVDQDRGRNQQRPIARWIRNPHRTVQAFVAGVKSACFENHVGYGSVSEYVISSVSQIIEQIVSSATIEDRFVRLEPQEAESVYRALLTCLELAYFLYLMHPTVASSFKLSKLTIVVYDCVSNTAPTRLPFLKYRVAELIKQVVMWTKDSGEGPPSNCTAIEVINILLTASHLKITDALEFAALEDHFKGLDDCDYFATVSVLFYVRDDVRYAGLRQKIEQRLLRKIGTLEFDVLGDAQHAHLFFDMVACPFLSLGVRSKILNAVRQKCALRTLPDATSTLVVKEMGEVTWFVNWPSVDLLSMIRKKELSAVY
jgi:hypothetical protein